MASLVEAGHGVVPVICVHGLPGRAQDFRWLFAPLADRARIIAIDLPGFGGTPVETAPDASPEGRAAFVLDVIDALGLDRPVIVGHSMGGLVAVAAIAMRPDGFRALGLLSSPGLRPHASFKRIPKRFLHFSTHGALAPLMRPLVRRLFAFAGFRNYPDSALARTVACLRMTSIEAHAARLRTMTLPTLAAWCEDDKLIEPAILSELAASLPAGPRLVWPTGGHVPQKTHAAEVADGIAALLLG
jgi:pimeloyl-ACP methyl ester carboxylesterase